MIGLKQGCILSPCLFSLFIADLRDEIEDGDAFGMIWGETIYLIFS